jgi:glutaredoxin
MEVYLIYGVTDCPACLRAQAALMDLEIEYVFIEMDFSKSYRKSIKNEFDWGTFPVIVKLDSDGEHLVGGYDELACHIIGESEAPS